MKRMSKKWLALMLAASLVISEGSFVSLAQTSTPSATVVETTVEDGTDVSVGNASEVSTSDGNDVSVDDAFKMFPGLSEGVTLGEEDAVRREDLNANIEKTGFEEGVDCIANEILVMADTEALAQEYAAAYNGTLTKYTYGVAVIALNANEELPVASVEDAVKASADPANNLPVAWPNTICYILPIEVEHGAGAEDVTVVANEAEGKEAAMDVNMAQGEDYNNLLAYNDPYLKTSSDSYQWFHAAIGSAYAWNAGYTGTGVKVCVIDTGAKLSHEDLNVARYAVDSMNGDLEDVVGHGSHVCGLVAGIANNGKGGTGVAPGVTLSSIKIAAASSFDSSVVIEALGMAKDLGVDIVNLSLGSAKYNGVYAAKIKELYDVGIAVICAAGNESTAAWAYPASYPGAISIAALDRFMQRTFFSNHGSSTDFAAPGWDMYSCYKNATDSYYSMDGTSMACPVAAGTAAIVLQYARKTGAYTETNTSKDVDNLVKLMSKGAVKAGTGTGKGYVSLPKVLGLSTAVTAPNAPKFDVKAGSYSVASMNVKITAEPGCTIYYSTNGKTPTYKNGVVTNGTLYNGSYVTITGNKTVTLKAIAVSSTKMVSKVASAKYTLKPQVSGLTLGVKGGVSTIQAGKSLTINAIVAPAYAANKKLDWAIAPAGQGVTVKNGKVTASKNATPGTYTVTATAKDGSNVSKSIAITVKAADANPIAKITKVTKGNVTLINGDMKIVEIQVTKKDKTTVPVSNVVWSTDNSGVAVVSGTSTGGITIKGVAKGKTNIVGTAADGSGVTIKIPVTVGNKVSKIVLSGNNKLAVGKSLSIAATVNPSDAANKKLNWTVAPAGQGVTVKNGKVTASKTATPGNYTVTATAADGYGATANFAITVEASPITKIALSGSKTVNLFRVSNGMGAAIRTTIPVTVTGGNTANWKVTSSAPGIVNAYKSGNNIIVEATGNGTGSATVTVATTDGSNKKATCKVVVKNPASNLELSVPGGRCYDLAKGKSLQLKAVFETEFGKLDASSKKLKWTSSNPDIATVSAGGKVTAKSNDGSVLITATATDGSGLSASVWIYMTTDIKQIRFSDGYYYISSVRIPVGYSTTVKAHAMSYDGGSYWPSEDLATSVTGNGGVGVSPSGSSFKLVGNKKGTYTFTVSCQNGSTAKGKLKVIVY